MKLMVCGSRTIVDGGAKGVDTYAAHWANANNVAIEWFRSDWAHYGRGAGVVRNKQMAEIIISA